ncbi:MAG TPA: HET-C-related protein [Gaiellaceae bacterium]
MSKARDHRHDIVEEQADASRLAEVAPVEAPSLAGLMLQVQQGAGNAAVGRLLRAKGDPRTHGNRRAAAAGPPPAGTKPRVVKPVLMRYQAGERGHGGIEEEGLRAAGFGGDMSSGEIGKVYLGNWMRDWSQVPPGPAKSRLHTGVMAILSVLSMGEFGTPVTDDQVGGYLASEHMDNPLGGGSPEAPGTTPEELAAAAAAEAQLSPDQREALKRERTPEYQAMIAAASAASGLPDYIERGKDHAKQKLTEAVMEANGRDQAMMDMGNALHSIEDYFSHSNFTEVALAMLAKEGNSAAGAVLTAAKTGGAGFDATTAGGTDSHGRAGIVTGTYGAESHSANKVVSMVEQLKTECLTGALRISLIRGMARTTGVELGHAARSATNATVGPAAAAAGGAGGFLGGMAAGFNAGHGVFGTLGSMATGAVEGAEAGADAAYNAVGDVGEGIGDAVGEDIGGTVGAAMVLAATPLFAVLDGVVAANLDEWLMDERTAASAVGAPGGAPTHSQLAKDAPEHAVFQTSRALAVNADTVIGGAVRAAWSAPDKAAAVGTVTPLVDQIVAHPEANRGVWEGPLTAALAATK